MVKTDTVNELGRILCEAREGGRTVGFVPTMGALHAGHLALIRRSIRENDYTVCSIFVNPIQFNNPDDLTKYPRMPEKDAEMLEQAGCNLLFIPSEQEIYPGGVKPEVNIDFGDLDKVMEGRFRPGHFQGVAVVVKRLFDLVRPSRAYFGKKDYQQLAIIRHMVNALALPVEIVPCETVRESDGLAMSSRNLRLSQRERAIAPAIFSALEWVRDEKCNFTPRKLALIGHAVLSAIPAFNVEYFEIADADTLLPISSWTPGGRAVAFAAVFLGEVRLIDNIELF